MEISPGFRGAAKGGERERVHDLDSTLEQDAQEEQEAHDGGAQDGGLPADDQGEGDRHDAGHQRRAPARHADRARVAKTEEARSATLKPDTARRW